LSTRSEENIGIMFIVSLVCAYIHGVALRYEEQPAGIPRGGGTMC